MKRILSLCLHLMLLSQVIPGIALVALAAVVYTKPEFHKAWQDVYYLALKADIVVALFIAFACVIDWYVEKFLVTPIKRRHN